MRQRRNKKTVVFQDTSRIFIEVSIISCISNDLDHILRHSRPVNYGSITLLSEGQRCIHVFKLLCPACGCQFAISAGPYPGGPPFSRHADRRAGLDALQKYGGTGRRRAGFQVPLLWRRPAPVLIVPF